MQSPFCHVSQCMRRFWAFSHGHHWGPLFWLPHKPWPGKEQIPVAFEFVLRGSRRSEMVPDWTVLIVWSLMAGSRTPKPWMQHWWVQVWELMDMPPEFQSHSQVVRWIRTDLIDSSRAWSYYLGQRGKVFLGPVWVGARTSPSTHCLCYCKFAWNKWPSGRVLTGCDIKRNGPLSQISKNSLDTATNCVDCLSPILAPYHSEETLLVSSNKWFQIIYIPEQRIPALLQLGTFPSALLMKSHFYLHKPGSRKIFFTSP